MDIRGLQRTWDSLGREDPLWAVLSDPEKRGGRWDLDEFLATGVREIEEVMEWLRSVGVGSPRGAALDFGCGVGRLTQPLAERVGRAVGIDIAPSMIEEARRINRSGDRCRFELNERDDLSRFDEGTFDLVYSNITLQHMPPALAARYLREMVRVLTPAGVLVFQLPSSPPGDLRSRLKRLLPPGARARWRHVRQRLGAPARMQMYWMTPEQVSAIVAERDAVVVATKDDYAAGPDWSGKRYAVRRRAAAS